MLALFFSLEMILQTSDEPNLALHWNFKGREGPRPLEGREEQQVDMCWKVLLEHKFNLP